jgi:enoyl-CoA hydratase
MNTLLYEVKDKICFITLNRPKSLNAINEDMVIELGEAFDKATEDENVHVIVLAGAGERAFSAGFDINESISSPIIEVVARRENTQLELDSFRKIWTTRKPVVASVHGYCIGGALHMAFMCDLMIVADNAQFGEPEVAFSYVPDVLIEPWKMNMNLARELLYLGEYMSAEDMYRAGVANRVVKPENLEEETLRIATRLASMPTDTMQMLKYQVNKTYEIKGIINAMDFAAEIFNQCRINQAQTQDEFNNIVQEKGLKAALEWQEAQK